MVEEEDGWNVPEVQIQPTTFQFRNLPVEPSSGSSSQPLPKAAVSPVSLEDPVGSGSENLHIPADGDSSAESEASLPVGEGEPEPGENLPETEGIPSTCVPENLPAEEPVLPGQAETSPSQSEQLLSPPPISVEAPNLPDPVIRRTSRQREPPNHLQYAALGNPLISVIQTLFHGFVDAYSEALSTAAATDLMKSRVYNV